MTSGRRGTLGMPVCKRAAFIERAIGSIEAPTLADITVFAAGKPVRPLDAR